MACDETQESKTPSFGTDWREPCCHTAKNSEAKQSITTFESDTALTIYFFQGNVNSKSGQKEFLFQFFYANAIFCSNHRTVPVKAANVKSE
jgi:hypothetical protein